MCQSAARNFFTAISLDAHNDIIQNLAQNSASGPEGPQISHARSQFVTETLSRSAYFEYKDALM